MIQRITTSKNHPESFNSIRPIIILGGRASGRSRLAKLLAFGKTTKSIEGYKLLNNENSAFFYSNIDQETEAFIIDEAIMSEYSVSQFRMLCNGVIVNKKHKEPFIWKGQFIIVMPGSIKDLEKLHPFYKESFEVFELKSCR